MAMLVYPLNPHKPAHTYENERLERDEGIMH